HPIGQVHPFALDLLTKIALPTAGLRSKGWDEFAAPGAPMIDFVFTVCDNAASEVCPIWPGHPMTAHWGVPDPAAVEGTEEVRRRAFTETLRQLTSRIRFFVSLPMEKLDRIALQYRLHEIGRDLPKSA